MDIEFVDRYTGTPHEGKPWLRGCWGPCEAMGFYPSDNPSEWPPNSEPDDIGYVFVICPDCNGTGNVSRWVAFKRMPRLFKSWIGMMWHGGPEDDRWRVIKFSMSYFPREIVRAFTWKMK
jgi:hypothetical protein